MMLIELDVELERKIMKNQNINFTHLMSTAIQFRGIMKQLNGDHQKGNDIIPQ